MTNQDPSQNPNSIRRKATPIKPTYFVKDEPAPEPTPAPVPEPVQVPSKSPPENPPIGLDIDDKAGYTSSPPIMTGSAEFTYGRPERRPVGRPKSGRRNATKSIYFSDLDLVESLDELCATHNISVSAVAQQLFSGLIKARHTKDRYDPELCVVTLEMRVRL